MYELSCGDPVGIRTLDLLIRSQSLYPAELPSHVGDLSLHKATQTPLLFGRGRRSRTLNQWFWRPLLYQLSYAPIKISGFLSSQGASPQVLSAFVGLTAVFGMGTGGSLQPSPLNYLFFRISYPDNCIKSIISLTFLLLLEICSEIPSPTRNFSFVTCHTFLYSYS